MEKFLDLIERHKYGILATLFIHLAVFLYFQVATYREAILFEPWDFQYAGKEAPDDIEINIDQIETPEDFFLFNPQENISSFVKDENDTREKSNRENYQYTSSYREGNAKNIEDAYEQSIKDEIDKNRKQNPSETSPNADIDDKKKDNKPPKEEKKGSSEATSGQTMVSYSLTNRRPHNNNDWYVRNPGYTCGEVNGVVKVKIIVNEAGNVTNVTIIQEQNANECMREKAKEYALMSRFNYDPNAPSKQEGTITYQFVFR